MAMLCEAMLSWRHCPLTFSTLGAWKMDKCIATSAKCLHFT